MAAETRGFKDLSSFESKRKNEPQILQYTHCFSGANLRNILWHAIRSHPRLCERSAIVVCHMDMLQRCRYQSPVGHSIQLSQMHGVVGLLDTLSASSLVFWFDTGSRGWLLGEVGSAEDRGQGNRPFQRNRYAETADCWLGFPFRCALVSCTLRSEGMR